MQTNHALGLFIEPTPYILGFLKELERQWDGQLDIIFLKENHTQDWNVTLPAHSSILSASLFKKVNYLRQQVRKKRYAIIHIAGWGELACLYVLLLAKLKQIPVAMESDTQLQKHIPNWKKTIKQTYQRLFYPILFKLPDILLPGGTRQMKYFQHYGVSLDKLVNAQMTVDVQSLQQKTSCIKPEDRVAFRHEYGAQSSDVVFLYVGRFLDWKGIVELIEAFKIMCSPQAKLWLVGNGELENYVQQSAQEIDTIDYFGRASGDQLVEIYYAADVFVLPSFAEPWGLVVNEAMATENALIVSDNAGCVDDLIIHGKTGLIVPAKDVLALTKAMERLANHSIERIELARQAKKHIASWTLENEAKNVIRAWQRVI